VPLHSIEAFMNPVNAYFRRLQGMETMISEQSGLLQELALETIQQIEIEVPLSPDYVTRR
jgi:hypothetical protein